MTSDMISYPANMSPIDALARRSLLAVGVQTLLVGCVGLQESPLPAIQYPQSPGSRLARWNSVYHGFNVGLIGNPRINPELFVAARAYGADLVRAIIPFPGPKSSDRQWMQLRTAVRSFVGRASDVGLSVVLVPDTDAESTSLLWCEPTESEAFVRGWARLSRDLRDIPNVAGFDLLNEPNPPAISNCAESSGVLWNRLVRRCIAAIRAEDASVPIVVKGILGGSPQGLAWLDTFDDDSIVYSIHFYSPHDLTHQRVSGRWPHALRYPTIDLRELEGTTAYPGPWNRERLRLELDTAVARARSDRVPMYVGEFSCVRWAPSGSAARYVEDCLALFGEFGWSWTYHEFRGWSGWDPEVGGEAVNSSARRSDAPVISHLRRAMTTRSMTGGAASGTNTG